MHLKVLTPLLLLTLTSTIAAQGHEHHDALYARDAEADGPQALLFARDANVHSYLRSLYAREAEMDEYFNDLGGRGVDIDKAAADLRQREMDRVHKCTACLTTCDTKASSDRKSEAWKKCADKDCTNICRAGP